MSPHSGGALLHPELSIIIPVLDEIDELPEFLAGILLQQEVCFEIIIVDGGSRDGTLEWLHDQHSDCIRIISSDKGRGRQLNTGVAAAYGEWFLLLHVDSRFDDVLALRTALDVVKRTSPPVAGHFPLTFRRTNSFRSFAYYFYEAKSATNRAETIHGDQGFLLHRDLFSRVGSFDFRLPVMEDTEYAERVRHVCRWMVLPGTVGTSARRFETEGLWQRQLLGALIMCFRSIGWDMFFQQAPNVYRLQNSACKLQVLPFFLLVKKLLKQLPETERRQIWSQAGAYVRRHAWQLFFCVDTFIAYLRHQSPHQISAPVTCCCEPVFNVLTNNRGGRFCATLLLRGWFYVAVFILSKLENRRQHS